MLNVLALGDSIMWGQGNEEADKFTTLVCNWLATERGKPTKKIVTAHSGAIATPTPQDGVAALWGEVPEAAPSILAQCASVKDPVDVVLVNGGINDVSALHIVVADPFDPNGAARLQQTTSEVFTGPVSRLLLETLTTFTDAKVVVLGYYPIISEQTRAAELVKLMKHLPRPAGVPNTFDWVVEHLADDLIEVAVAAEKKRMVDQCFVFHEASRNLLAALVESLNDGAYRGRIALAVPEFQPENAFAAPDTWLWSGSDDPKHGDRVREYADQLTRDPLAWPMYTPVASICHPNTRGAIAYADAIKEALIKLGF